MDKYTLHISHTLVSKNKIQAAIKDFLMTKINQVIYDDLGALKREISNKIVEINREYYRCKPVEVRFLKFSHNDNYITLQDIPNVNASILILKEKEVQGE